MNTLTRPAPPPGFEYDDQAAQAGVPATAAPTSTLRRGTAGMSRPAPPPGFSYDEGPAPPAPAPSGYGLMDIPKAVAGGAIRGVGSLVRGAGEMLDSLPDAMTGAGVARQVAGVPQDTSTPQWLRRPGTALGDAIGTPIQKAGDWVKGSESDAAKAIQEKPLVEGELTKPDSWRFGEGASSPMNWALKGGEMVGNLAPMLAGAEVTGARALQRVAGMTPEIAAAIRAGKISDLAPAAQAIAQQAVSSAGRASLVSGAVAGGLQGGEDAAQGESQRVQQMSDDDLMALPAYKAMIDRGMTPEAARDALATQVREKVFGTTAPIAMAAGGVSTLPLLQRAQGVLGGVVGNSVLRRAAAGAALEAPVQGAMAVGQSAAQVAAANSVTGEQRDPMADSLATFGAGAAPGAVFGALGGLHRPAAEPAPAPDKPLLALPAPVFPVDSRGQVSNTNDQFRQQQLTEARANYGITPDIERTQQALWDSQPKQRFPGAAPGSLSDAANAIPAAAADGTRQSKPVASDARRAEAVTPTWVDQTTGAVAPATRDQLVDSLANQMLAQHQLDGTMRISSPALEEAWGIPAEQIKRARRDAELAAKDRLAAAESAAMKQQDTTQTDASAEPAPAISSDDSQPSAAQGSETQAAADTGNGAASIPFMITQAMKRELRGRGMSDSAIAKLTPQEAHDVLRSAPADESVPTGTEEPAAPGEAASAGTEEAKATSNETASAAPPSERADSVEVTAPKEEQEAAPRQEPVAEAVSPEGDKPVEAPRKEEVATAPSLEGTASVETASTPAAKEKAAPLPEEVPLSQGGTEVAPSNTSAARSAESVRVKTPDGELNGRTHVDRLIAEGFDQIKSGPAGDRMVHSLINAEGKSQPIRAGQLRYAEERIAARADKSANVSTDKATAVEQPSRVDAAAAEAAPSPHNDLPEPTPAQQEAGNFKMGHVRVHGLDVSIEVPKGGMRRGTDANGAAWERPVSDHYGYIKRTEGADGEQVDVYMGRHAEDSKRPVFVVDQVKPGTKQFDEHKVMLGYKNAMDARSAYEANFPKGLKTFGGIRRMSVDEFKGWLKDGDQTKPAMAMPSTPSTPVPGGPKRGGITTSGGKARVVGGKLEYIPHARETLEAYFKPGTEVKSSGGMDRVESFHWNGGDWHVSVRALREDGTPYPAGHQDAGIRTHSTSPDMRAIVAKLGKPEMPEKSGKAAKRVDPGAGKENVATAGRQRNDTGDAAFMAPLVERADPTGSVLESVRRAKESPAYSQLFDLVGSLEKKRISDDQLPKLQQVVDGLSKGFGISRVTLELHDKSHGEFGNMLGVYRPSEHVVSLNREALRSHEAVSVLFHEYGHHMVRQLLGENLEHSARGDAMYRAYMAWKRELAPEATVREARASRQAFFRNLYRDRADGSEDRSPSMRDASPEARAYTLDADEFFADMISRALYDHEGAQKLLGQAGGIFDRIAHAMKMVFDLLRGYDPRLTDTPQAFRDFVNETWNPLGRSDEAGTSRVPETAQPMAQGDLFSRDGWDEKFPDAVLAHPLNAARDHADYAAAKSGDNEAALRLARDLVTPDYVERVRAQLPEGSKPVIVPVVAREASGNNRIPDAAAEVLAHRLGTTVDRSIVQSEKVARSNADAMGRLANQPTFEGTIEPGRQYVLLDDTLTQGGTLAQLKTNIERQGGQVILATALTGKEYSRKLALDPQTLGKVRERFGRIEGWWRREFGYGFDGLTQSEARTVLTYDGGKLSPDALRDRILAGRIPGLRRLGEEAAGDRPGAEAPGAGRGPSSEVKPDLDDSGRATPPGEEPRPFSRAAKSIEALQEGLPKSQEGLLKQAKEWVAGKLQDFKPAALGALQLRHVLELMEDSKNFPGAKHYADIHQRMDSERTQMINTAAEKTERWQKWAYEKGLPGMMGRLKPEAKVLSRFIHDVTQLGIDPSDSYKKLLMEDSRGEFQPWTKELVRERIKELQGQIRGRAGDDKTQLMEKIKDLKALPAREKAREARYPELAARWQALSPEAKEIFHMAREQYQEQSDSMERALLDRIDAMNVPETYKRSLADRIRFQFEASRVEGVYFPLSRFGDYWVAGTHRDGTPVFGMFESFRDAQRAEERLKSAGVEIEAHGLKDTNYRAKDAPSGTFVSDVIGILRKAGAPEKVQDEIYQTFLKTLPEMSMRKHGIHRKNVAGYNDDALRAFAKNGFHGAHQVARLKYGFQMQGALDAMAEAFENRRNAGSLGGNTEMSLQDAASGDAMLGELRRRHDWIMSPKDSQMANVAGSVGFLYYMSASPASALVNLTQGAQITLPVLGARHGWGKATRELLGATKDAMRTGGNILRTLRSDEERQAFKVLEERGTFNRTATHTLAGISEGNALASNPAWAKVMGAMGYLFHKAEVINRESAGVAAFRLARGEGKSFDDAVRYADDIVNGTHFDFSNANRARYMQGNVAKVLTQFKSYSLGMSWVLYRNLYKALAGETPEVRQLARRTLTGVLGMTGLMAGAMGLPIINLIRYGANAVHAVTGDDDTPWDFNTEFRSWLAEHLGETAASWVADGAVNQLTGANIAGRTGMADMWFRDPDRELEGKDAYYNLLDTIAGPLGGLTKNLFVGSQMMGEGQTWRGIETMLPKFAKDGMKAVRYAKEGANTLRGDPIVPDVSGPEVLLQALGFSPAKLAEQQRVNNALMNYQKFIQDRRQSLLNAFAMAQLAGDEDGRGDALAKIQDFNAKYPEIAIRPGTIRESLRTRAQRTAQADNGIMLNRKLASRVKAEVGAMAGD